MDATGTTYKLIREAKQISQTSISKNLSITRTALSKIENNKNFTNFPTMIELLDQINMSFEEFLFIANGYNLSEKQQFVTDFFSLSNKNPTDMLTKLEQGEATFVVTESSLLMKDIYKLVHSYEQLKRRPSSVTIKQMVKKNAYTAWEKLTKMDEWYLLELKLINRLLFIFPAQLSLSLAPRFTKEIQKYKNFPEIKELSLSIYKNLSTLFFNQNDLISCLKISKQLKDLSKAAKRYDLHAVSLIRIGICSSSMELIEKGLHILDIIEDYPLKKSMLVEVESRLF